MSIMTRKEYLDSVSPEAHRRYYGGIVEISGGPKIFAKYIPVSIEQLKAALAAGDTSFNSIANVNAWTRQLPPIANKALRAVGDYPTQAGAVCVLKEAARQLAETTLAKES